MATLRLNDRRVVALKPRKSAYDTRDRDPRGFGVRGPALGRKVPLHPQPAPSPAGLENSWLGGAIGADEARERAKTLIAAIRKRSEDEAAAPPDGSRNGACRATATLVNEIRKGKATSGGQLVCLVFM